MLLQWRYGDHGEQEGTHRPETTAAASGEWGPTNTTPCSWQGTGCRELPGGSLAACLWACICNPWTCQSELLALPPSARLLLRPLASLTPIPPRLEGNLPCQQRPAPRPCRRRPSPRRPRCPMLRGWPRWYSLQGSTRPPHFHRRCSIRTRSLHCNRQSSKQRRRGCLPSCSTPAHNAQGNQWVGHRPGYRPAGGRARATRASAPP